MAGKMNCHISDGPQIPEDVPGYEEPDGDDAYESYRQDKIDSGECMSCHQPHLPDSPYCADCDAPREEEKL